MNVRCHHRQHCPRTHLISVFRISAGQAKRVTNDGEGFLKWKTNLPRPEINVWLGYNLTC